MPQLVDTTIRLLGQEPLAGRIPTADVLRLAGTLDRAGYAYLEVSGGGCFDSAVRRGVESPWERIRALRDRTKTPLGLALRGRFLVGTKPVDGDFARRFVASAAENGIDVFRLNDPLNDVSNLADAADAIAAAGREFEGGLVYSPGPPGDTDTLLDRARRLTDLGAARVLLHDPSGSLQPHRAHELIGRMRESTGIPVGIYCQGSAALATALEAARGGADLIATAVYPVAFTLHRVSGEALSEALAGLGLDPGVNVDLLWEASDLVDEHIGDEPVTPLAPRVAVRAAQHDLPAGLIAALDAHLRAHAAGDRMDEVIEELERVREEAGSPPLAAPIGQILASQALLHVLSASRYQTVADEFRALVDGRYGTPPGPVDATVRRAVALTADPESEENAAAPALSDLRDQAEGLAASEEELLLLGLFGAEAEPLLQAIRGRSSKEETLASGGVDQARAEKIREIVRIVQESGVAEITIEEDDLRVSVRRTEDPAPLLLPPQPVDGELDDLVGVPPPPVSDDVVRVESPMVGTFYRGPEPGAAPFVEEGDPVAPGQTLCILEAMKLMNEVKAEQEAVVSRILVGNAEPVEFGQLLFELEPLNGRPLDAL